MRRRALCASTVDFFKPLMPAYEPAGASGSTPNGRILGGNAGMRILRPGWSSIRKARNRLGAYLGKDFSVQDVLDLPDKLGQPTAAPSDSRRGARARCTSSTLVQHGKGGGRRTGAVRRTRVRRQRSRAQRHASATGRRSDAAVIPTGDKVDYRGNRGVEEDRPHGAEGRAHQTNVLLLGETGTGTKWCCALHRRSGRTGEFVAINCRHPCRATSSSHQSCSGYEGGRSTGARGDGRAVGKFEFADGGTLFLDKISEIPVDMQVSLLRVLQEQSVTKLGSEHPRRRSTVRVIAATNQNIERLISRRSSTATCTTV